MTSKIFFQLHNPTGMINQVMSIELAVGISHITNSPVLVHYVSNNGDQLYDFKTVPIYTPSRWYNAQRSGFTNPDHFPHLTDILEWDADLILIDQKIERFPQERQCIENLSFDYYLSHEQDITNRETSFADGRKRLELTDNIHLKGTLGWYSRFFYNRDPGLDKALASVKFKKEYIGLADEICNSLGNFQGGHLRLSDHIRMFNTTQEMFESGLDKLEQNNLPIVISTDEPGHKMVLDNRHRFILLDEYIVNNFANQFKQLKFQDEVVFGLLCNLVMHKARRFIGTSGSTYTAYIHRVRYNSGMNEQWEFWDNPNQSYFGEFSWDGYDLESGKKMWWREWPESKLNF